MAEYIALCWNPSVHGAAIDFLVSRATDAVPNAKLGFRSEGCIVLISARSVARTQEIRHPEYGHGLILGTLFQNECANDEANGSLPKLGIYESAKIIQSEGLFLIEHYWGSFIAIISSKISNRFSVIPSPFGSIPCLHGIFDGVSVFSSSLEIFFRLNISRFSLNANFLSTYVYINTSQGTATGINELSEIKPGQCCQVTLLGKVSKKLYWNPFEVASECISPDIVSATSAVREAAYVCTNSWSKCHQRLVHKLSGGLDSAVVLGCLRKSDSFPQITCITDYSLGSDSDERQLARLSTQQSVFRHIEQKRDPSLRFEEMLKARPTAVPYLYFMELVNARPARRVAHEVNATAIFSGSYGDELFFRWPANLALVDCIRQHRLGGRSLKTAWDIALYERKSIWRVLFETTKRYRAKSGVWDLLQNEFDDQHERIANCSVPRTFLQDDTLLHPWLLESESITRAHPGKLHHILSLAGGHFDDPFPCEFAEDIHPLASQPLVEACLRVPTYVHLSGGIDRVVERMAFASDIPTEIYRRTAKGGLEEYARDVTLENLKFITELLLDGELVKQGLLNRANLEKALTSSFAKSYSAEIRLHACTEVWLQLIQDELRASDAKLMKATGTNQSTYLAGAL